MCDEDWRLGNNTVPTVPSDLDGCIVLDGTLYIRSTGELEAVFPYLQEITGDLAINSNIPLERVDFPSLTKVGGAVSVTGNPALTFVGLEQLEEATHAEIQANAVWQNFDALRSLRKAGMVELRSTGAQEVVDLGSLEEAELVGIGLRDITGVDLSSLRQVGLLSIIAEGGQSQLRELDFPALEEIDELQVHNHAQLERISLRANPTEMAGLMLSENPSLDALPFVDVEHLDVLALAGLPLETISFPNLVDVGELRLEPHPRLRSFSAPALVEARTVDVTLQATLETLDLPALQRANEAVHVMGNDVLGELNLPSLTATPAFMVFNNPSLPACRVEALVDQLEGEPSVTIVGNDEASLACE